jgi:hypothetical protein
VRRSISLKNQTKSRTIYDFMKKHQIFISSPISGLESVRMGIIREILKTGNIPVAMEVFSPDGKNVPLEAVKNKIRECEFFVLIIAERLAPPYMDDRSFTELEYDYAVSLDLPILRILPSDDVVTAQSISTASDGGYLTWVQFVKKLRDKYQVESWRNKDEIPSLVSSGIQMLIKEHNFPGWTQDYSPLWNNIPMARQFFSDFNEVKIKAKSLVSNGRRYELNVLEWISESAASGSKHIGSDVYTIPVPKPSRRVRDIFGALLRRMREHDNYHSLSTLSFWEKEHGKETSFLDENLYAVKNEVKIERIILIDEDLFRWPDRHRRQLKLLQKLTHELLDRRKKDAINFGRIKTCFHITDQISDYALAPCAFFFDDRDVKIEEGLIRSVNDGANYMQISHLDAGLQQDELATNISFQFYPIHQLEIRRNHKKFLDIRTHDNLTSIDEMAERLKSNKILQQINQQEEPIRDFKNHLSFGRYEDSYNIATVNAKHDNELVDLMAGVNQVLIKIKHASDTNQYTIVGTSDQIAILTGRYSASVFASASKWILFSIQIPEALDIPGCVAHISGVFAMEQVSICIFTLPSAEFLLVKEEDLDYVLKVMDRNGMDYKYHGTVPF